MSECYYEEPAKKLKTRKFDVVVAGGGTAGVVAAIASARQGMSTVLIESKGYLGGTVVEGGTALHSFYNIWKAYPGVEKRQVVKGIPAEIIGRLAQRNATSGYAEQSEGYDYDSVCTAIDTEVYKYVVFEMLAEAGVHVCVNTFLADAVTDGRTIKGVIVENHSGREVFFAKSFVDCTGYGDLSADAGALFNEPNDYPVANSMGVGGVDVEAFYEYLKGSGAVDALCLSRRDGEDGKVVRVSAELSKLPEEFAREASKIGLAIVTTSLHDDYFMFLKLDFKIYKGPTDRDTVSKAELELRRRQMRAIELLRSYIPGCERAFIARTSPSLNIRRGRVVTCDYDLSINDVLSGRHFDDDVLAYGFHDRGPLLHIGEGGTYGIPYRALIVSQIENLLAAGMMITSSHEAHMSTRNTVSCMAQGQAAGTAAALCAKLGCATRELPYPLLREALLRDGVVLENGGENQPDCGS